MRSAGFISPFGKENYDCDKVDQEYAKFFDKSKQFSLYGRFHGNIFNSDKLLMTGLEMRFILSRASNKFCCMGSDKVDAQTTPIAVAGKAKTEPKLNLTDVSIFIRKVRVSKSILSAHDKTLQSSRALYPIKRSVVSH